MKQKFRTFGAEIEKPVSDKNTCLPHKTSQAFFKFLQTEAKKRKAEIHLHTSDIKPDIVMGVISSDLGEQGIDNGWNLLESSLHYKTSLQDIYQSMKHDLALTLEGLKKENATVINMSNHPLGDTKLQTYKDFVGPKSLYAYLNDKRGWTHSAGIDAKAQNSPSTGVPFYEAADAVSVIIGTGAATIALFGNSPYQDGKLSGIKDSRQLLWDAMFGTSKITGDLRVSKFPPHRFRTLASYFSWMFGENSSIHFVLDSTVSDYKSVVDLAYIIKGDPPLLTYFAKENWEANRMRAVLEGTRETAITVSPKMADLELLQWAQFIGARIRFKLKDSTLTPSEFVNACREVKKQKVEELFEKHAEFTYIEGRDAAANFPDRELLNESETIALTTMIAPSALQAGLIQNLAKSVQFIDTFKWNDLKGLRDAAVKDGLEGTYNGHSVYDFTKRVLNLASDGLSKSDRKLLAYAEYVLKSEQNGADRAIKFVEGQKGSLRENIKTLVQSREVVMPRNAV